MATTEFFDLAYKLAGYGARVWPTPEGVVSETHRLSPLPGLSKVRRWGLFRIGERKPMATGPLDADLVQKFMDLSSDDVSTANVITLLDTTSKKPGPPIRVRIFATEQGIEIYPEGYGEPDAANGSGSPVVVDYTDGELRAIVFADINAEKPTIISLANARESERAYEDEVDADVATGKPAPLPVVPPMPAPPAPPRKEDDGK